MTFYKTLGNALRAITTTMLVGMSVSLTLSAAAIENTDLSAEFHAAAMKAAQTIKEELRLELAETVRPDAPLVIKSMAFSAQMDDNAEAMR